MVTIQPLAPLQLPSGKSFANSSGCRGRPGKGRTHHLCLSTVVNPTASTSNSGFLIQPMFNPLLVKLGMVYGVYGFGWGLPHYLPKQLCQDSNCPFPILFGQLSPKCLESVSFLATQSPKGSKLSALRVKPAANSWNMLEFVPLGKSACSFSQEAAAWAKCLMRFCWSQTFKASKHCEAQHPSTEADRKLPGR